ncbi:MAG: cytochrome c biogenesis protein CcdA [Candidatus Melainabacteria bacterium]|nr:cytochrome c biogenesis protein CcdA [Candidatus Melainabacteria bacterium]
MSNLIEALFIQRVLNPEPGPVLLLSFLGGVLSSLLPCTLAMVPVMVGYIGAYGSLSRWAVFRQALLFVLGNALVLSVLGLTAASLGHTLTGITAPWLLAALGTVLVLVGLQLLDVLHLPLPSFVKQLPDLSALHRAGLGWLVPLCMGVAFGLSSSPCGTPYLVGILSLISRSQAVWLGGASLFVYALGQGLLLVVVGVFTGLLQHRARLLNLSRLLNTLSGLIFIALGLGLLVQSFGWLG